MKKIQNYTQQDIEMETYERLRYAKQLRDMQNTMRRSNINLTRVNLPEGENKRETILETLTQFSCPDKSINSQIKESQFIAKDKYMTFTRGTL